MPLTTMPFFEHFTLMIPVAPVSIAVMFNGYNNYCIFYSDTRETVSEEIEVTKVHVYNYIYNGK